MRSITEEIAELRTLDAHALAVRYEALYGRPPRVKQREFLWKRCAWKLQEQRYGGLSTVAKHRLEELIAEIRLPDEDQLRTVTGRLTKEGAPTVGSALTREWRGRHIAVRVLDNGFEFEGVIYGSLSAAVRAITGAHWNGKLFFGLTERKRK